MDGGDFKEQLDKDISYANSSPYEIRVECDEGLGSITSIALLSQKVTDQFNVEFKIASGVQFVGWKAYSKSSDGTYSEISEDYIKFLSYNTESSDGIYKASVKFVKGIEGIVIKPYCFLLPKVTSITPKFESSGCEQDTTLKISFNKAVDETTFDKILSFANITIKGPDGSDLKKHYENPSLITDSNGNSVLVILPKKPTKIISDEESVSTKDITLSIDLSGAKDKDGLEIPQPEPYTYRLNKNVDNVAPSLTSAKLFTTADTTSIYYKELTGKDFLKTDGTDGNWESDDYHQNHIKDSLYFELSGSDAGSGVQCVQVSETYFRSVTGEETTDTVRAYQISCTESDGVYSANYKLNSSNDGAIKLDFALVDYAGNVSAAKTFYVIMDTRIDEGQVKFEECSQSNYKLGLSTFSKIRMRDGKNDTVTLTLSTAPQDIFYGDYKTDYNVSVKWGTSKEDISNHATKETEGEKTKFIFTHNAYQDIFVQITVSDELGNTRNLLRAIPSQAVIQDITVTEPSDHSYNYCVMQPANKAKYKSLLDYYGAEAFSFKYLVKYTLDGEDYWYVSDPHGLESDNHRYLDQLYVKINNKYEYQGYTFYVYMLTLFRYGDDIYFSSVSDDYLSLTYATTYSKFESYEWVKTSASSTGLSTDYIVDSLKVRTEPILNSGAYMVTVDDEFLSRVSKDTSDITYSFIAKDIVTNIETESKSFSFLLSSPASYEIFLKAENASGQAVTGSSGCNLRINDSEESQQLELTKDLAAPSFYARLSACTYNESSAYFALRTPSYDNPTIVTDIGTAGLATDSKGLVLMDYYFIPCSGSTTSNYDIFTMKDLEQYSALKKTISFDSSATSLRIPFDTLEEGLYTLCMVVKDKDGNYAIKNMPVFRKRLGTLNFELDNRYIEFPENDIFEFTFYVNNSDGEWKESANSDLTISGLIWNSDSLAGSWLKIQQENCYETSVSRAGYHDTVYFYYDYQKSLIFSDAPKVTCLSKNVMEGLNGLSVLCDKSTFAHTLYCSKKLSDGTDESDIALWENKAMETGVMFASTNFSYGKDKYKDIPAGYYYTTIVHFADGTTIMTDVKQK